MSKVKITGRLINISKPKKSPKGKSYAMGSIRLLTGQTMGVIIINPQAAQPKDTLEITGKAVTATWTCTRRGPSVGLYFLVKNWEKVEDKTKKMISKEEAIASLTDA